MVAVIERKSRYSFDKFKHIHCLNGNPIIGTTTALGVISKPLTWWASGLAVEQFGWLHPKKNKTDDCIKRASEKLDEIKNMSIGQYVKLLDTAYRAHNTKKETSADDGIDRHALIEEYIKSKMTGVPLMFLDEPIKPFDEWCKKNVKKFLFSELHCYSEKLYCGGIADFGYVDIQDKCVLGDIKSSKDAYFSQWAQLGGYDIQISENGGLTADGDKVFTLDKPFDYHAIFSFGAKIDEPFLNYKTKEMKDAFVYALNLYKSNISLNCFLKECK